MLKIIQFPLEWIFKDTISKGLWENKVEINIISSKTDKVSYILIS